ncbi:hypothetical protein B296_00004150, partial [Ensete ventricosum]
DRKLRDEDSDRRRRGEFSGGATETIFVYASSPIPAFLREMSDHGRPTPKRRQRPEEKEEEEDKISSSSGKSVAAKGTPWWSEKRIWAAALAFRAANALLIQTYFNPDEHWQSLEVAHRVVFGSETLDLFLDRDFNLLSAALNSPRLVR